MRKKNEKQDNLEEQLNISSYDPSIEQEVESLIRAEAEHIPIPSSLHPDQMMSRLLEEKSKMRFEQMKKRKFYSQFAAVASFVFVVGLVSILGGRTLFIPNQMLQSNTGRGDLSVDAELSISYDVAGEFPASEDIAETAALTKQVDDTIFGIGLDLSLNQERELQIASSYAEIFSLLEANDRLMGQIQMEQFEMPMSVGDPLAPSSPSQLPSLQSASPNANRQTSESTTDGSTENQQVMDVNDGDLVKTDGNYLYVLNNNQISIIDIRENRLNYVTSIGLEEERFISEMSIIDQKLVVVSTGFDDGITNEATRRVVTWGNHVTYTQVYDVSNPSRPIDLGFREQSGRFYDMRIVDDIIYTFTIFTPVLEGGLDLPESFIPTVAGHILEATQIIMPQYQFGDEFTVISSASIQDPGQTVDAIAVFGKSGMNYIGQDYIFLTETFDFSRESGRNETCIRKIAYENGKFLPIAQTTIYGVINDSFSIDEYQGYLRVLTTVSYNGLGNDSMVGHVMSSLTILDSNLEVVRVMENLLEEELVHSARFMGDIVYLATFRPSNPMLSVDLSDPSNPEILGELKISGFSRYLHPFMGGLLGIGMELDENGMVIGGVKLSMYDISNPSQVIEKHPFVIPDTFGSNVEYNYRAALIHEYRNLVGFTTFGLNQTYHVFEYSSELGFVPVFDRTLPGHGEARGIYVGDRFFLISGHTIEVFSLDDFRKLNDLVL